MVVGSWPELPSQNCAGCSAWAVRHSCVSGNRTLWGPTTPTRSGFTNQKIGHPKGFTEKEVCCPLSMQDSGLAWSNLWNRQDEFADLSQPDPSSSSKKELTGSTIVASVCFLTKPRLNKRNWFKGARPRRGEIRCCYRTPKGPRSDGSSNERAKTWISNNELSLRPVLKIRTPMRTEGTSSV